MHHVLLKALLLLLTHFVCTCVFSQEISPAQYRLIEQDQHRIHLLEIDPLHFHIVAIKAHHHGMQRETVTSLVKRYGAYAGINGGFFHGGIWDGIPAGILKIKGEWIGLPTLPRAALGWTDPTEVLMDRILTQGAVEITGKKYPIQKMNVPLTKSKHVLFTPTFAQTPSLPEGMTELIFKNNQLIQKTQKGSNPIPAQGWAYRFYSPGMSDLPLGELGKVQITILPQIDKSPAVLKKWQACEYIVGGTPLMIKNHKVLTDFQTEKVKDTFLTQPHARTAVCIKPNGNWLFLVAEHTPQEDIPFAHQARGLTMTELSHFMTSLQCKDAINLDGGGSSALVIKNKMVNAMQIGDEESFLDLYYERPVSDAILILPR